MLEYSLFVFKFVNAFVFSFKCNSDAENTIKRKKNRRRRKRLRYSNPEIDADVSAANKSKNSIIASDLDASLESDEVSFYSDSGSSHDTISLDTLTSGFSDFDDDVFENDVSLELPCDSSSASDADVSGDGRRILNISRYVDESTTDADFHELLTSPIIAPLPIDERMIRGETQRPDTSDVLEFQGFRNSDVEIKRNAIYSLKNSIIEPYQPNTGQTIVKHRENT